MKQEQNLKQAQIFRFTLVKLTNPPIETARALNDLYTFECGQWVPIWNSQIIGRYKEIIGRYKEILKWAQIFQIYLGKTDDPPSLKQKLEMVYSFTFYAALYICCHYELCDLELSKWTGQSCFIILSCCCCCYCVLHHSIQMLLLCITHQ